MTHPQFDEYRLPHPLFLLKNTERIRESLGDSNNDQAIARQK